MVGLTKYCKEFHKVAVNGGFYETMNDAEEALMSNPELQRSVRDAFIAQKISMIQGELGEAIEAMRKDNYGLHKKDTFEDEIADTLLRIFDLCGRLDIDIEKQIQWKLNFNKSRERMHGKLF